MINASLPWHIDAVRVGATIPLIHIKPPQQVRKGYGPAKMQGELQTHTRETLSRQWTMPNSLLRHPNVSDYLFRRRIKAGWTTERALATPSQKRTPTIRVGGEPTTVAEARAKSGVGYFTYHSRLRLGWSKARAASTPKQSHRRRDARLPAWFEYRGRRLSLYAWARELDINYRTLHARIKRGLSFEEAVEHSFNARLPGKRSRRRPRGK